MKVERRFVGHIHLENEVDITDPCYANRGGWYRTTINIKPGTYNCYSHLGTDKYFGERVWINQIVIANGEDAKIAEEKIKAGRSWRKVATIGVDAGLAGFFNNKPDFTDEEWDDFCSWMWEQDASHSSEHAKSSYIRAFHGRDGFWTESGCGDGVYPVYAIKNNGKIVALEIRF